MNELRILWKLWTGYPTPKEFINSDYLVSIQTLAGFQLTLLITFTSIAVAFIPSAIVAYIHYKASKKDEGGRLLKLSRFFIINIIDVFIEFFRGIPLVILVLLVFILPYPIFGIRLPLGIRAVTAMSIYSGIYIFTIFLSGFKAVPSELLDTARILGMSKTQVFLKLQLPISTRVMLPVFLSMVVTVFKDSSVLYVAGVCELTFTARQMIISQSGNYFLVLFSVLAIYWGTASFGSWIIMLLEQKYRLNFN